MLTFVRHLPGVADIKVKIELKWKAQSTFSHVASEHLIQTEDNRF